MKQATLIEAFDDLERLELINRLPADIYSDIDILANAPVKFLQIVAAIELANDPHTRAKIALNYLRANGGLESISYTMLKTFLVNPYKCNKSVLRQLYLLERSIPTRAGGNHYTWVQRLKIFVDTSSLEHAVANKKLIELPSKLAFTRKSGDHENLHAGPGVYAADFYCWDPELNKCHAFVEFKHWDSSDVDAAKAYYADKHYGARYVLVFTSDHKYYLIDYVANIVTAQPELPVPELLIW